MTDYVKLSATKLPAWRLATAKEQGGKCPLCQRPLHKPVGDHDHSNGQMRAVLCNGCNAMLGKIENNAARNGLSDPAKLATYLKNVVPYLHRWRLAPSGLYHHTHRTEEQKRVRRNTKARQARARKKLNDEAE